MGDKNFCPLWFRFHYELTDIKSHYSICLIKNITHFLLFHLSNIRPISFINQTFELSFLSIYS